MKKAIQLASILISIASVMSIPCRAGVVASWHFDDASGNIVFDASGNSHNGTLINMSLYNWSDELLGGCLYFGGADSIPTGIEYVEFEDDAFDLAQGTWALMILVNGYGWAAIMSKDQDGYHDGGPIRLNPDGRLTFQIEASANLSINRIYSDGPIPQGIPVWVAVNWGPQGIHMYINGQLQQDVNPFTGGMVSSGGTLRLGCGQDNPQADGGKEYPYQGYIDEVSVYDDQCNPPIPTSAAIISGTISPPFPNLTIDVFQGGEQVGSALTLGDGTYSFPDLQPGTYSVQLSVPFGYSIGENPKTFTVVAGQTATCNFTLTPIPATISGTVTPPMEGLTVNLYDAAQMLVDTEVTDDDGAYAFNGLSPGTYSVELVPAPGYAADQPSYSVTVNWGQDGTANPSMTPIPASITGMVSGGYEGIEVRLYVGATLQETTEISTSGAYSFANLSQGDYFVDLVVPAGYSANQDQVPVHLEWGQTVSVGFQLTLQPVSIEVHVTPAYAGITIGVSCDDPVLYQSDPTAGNGLLSFAGLPGNAIYTVDMVLPLGFTPITPTTYTEYRTGGTTWAVSFQIAPIAAANNARSKGYWKHQVKANLTGNGSTDYSIPQLIGSATVSGLTDEIFEHFYGNLAAPIQVAGVTYTPGASNAAPDLEDLDATFNGNMAGGNIYKQACQQFLALLLNVTSGKVGQTTIASADGVSHSQAVVYIYDLLTAPDTNYELAKNIAETLNNAQMVANGVIPLSTPNVIFGDGVQGMVFHPSSFILHPASPNPFNPSTTLSFALPAAARVRLSVFDISGREVARLVDGYRDAGVHEVIWDAAGLPSGIYCARLDAGSRSAVQKLVLMK